jgi:hypothetical protein
MYIDGSTLFETAATEENIVWYILYVALLDQAIQVCYHGVTILTMNHAEQVITPEWHAPGPLITKGDKFKLAEASTHIGNQVIRNIPDHHGVGVVPEFVMAHNYAQPFDCSDLV